MGWKLVTKQQNESELGAGCWVAKERDAGIVRQDGMGAGAAGSPWTGRSTVAESGRSQRCGTMLVEKSDHHTSDEAG